MMSVALNLVVRPRAPAPVNGVPAPAETDGSVRPKAVVIRALIKASPMAINGDKKSHGNNVCQAWRQFL
jgi:hypothetical protein